MSAQFGPNTVRDNIRYFVLEGATKESLIAAVSEWTDCGWKPQGGVSVTEELSPSMAETITRLYQAVSR